MNSINVLFNNQSGEKLAAKLELPADSKPKAYAIFAHCFTCSKNLSAVVNISRALTMEGIGVLRFDFTGLGQSKGDFSETNFSSNIDDLIKANEFLKGEYNAPALIIGHSLGGAAVLAASHKLKNIQAVATIGAPADPVHVKHLFDKDLDEIEEKGEAQVSIGGRPFKVKKQLIDDLKKSSVKETLKELNKALLVMHSPQDAIVEVANARKIYESAMHPKSFISLDGADHLLSNKDDSMYVGKVIAAWAQRYLEFTETSDLSTDKQVVTRTGDDGYTTEIKAGYHFFLADEPESVGGKNLGPTPYDLLVAGLGACTSMTLRMYADRKKWPLEEVKVHLQHSKEHSQDCDNCEEKGAKIDVIAREIELFGDLTDEQKTRLLEIADKCPVHKTLHSDITIESKLKSS